MSKPILIDRDNPVDGIAEALQDILGRLEALEGGNVVQDLENDLRAPGGIYDRLGALEERIYED